MGKIHGSVPRMVYENNRRSKLKICYVLKKNVYWSMDFMCPWQYIITYVEHALCVALDLCTSCKMYSNTFHCICLSVCVRAKT